MIDIIKISDSWDCDCCGWIYNYSLVCKFFDKEVKLFYNDHFGNGELDHYEYSPKNIEIILNSYKEQFSFIGIELLHVEYNLKLSINDRDEMIFYSQFHFNINGIYRSYVYVVEDQSSLHSVCKGSFFKFFEFIDIDITYREEN